MSPTIFRYKKYRFFFFSREETRVHIHVTSPDGEAKFWLEPTIALADYYKFSDKELRELQELVEGKQNEIKSAWQKHFNC